ncbi:hypothetical protein AKJ60_00245 [candidate division MSBL1 archaeon SCGC-AAA385M11]|nr:hypothetical protein AKJ60_00245 [candidate division MSBL1 archaeon SCGC-AAA385M11]
MSPNRPSRPVKRRPGLVALGRIARSLFLVILLLGLSYALLRGYFWVTTLSCLALETVEVRGNHRFTDQEIMSLAGVEVGDNCLAISLGAVKRRLSANPWLEDVLVRRVLPDRLEIAVREKQAVFWIRHREDLYYAQADGRPIAPVEAENFASLPLLTLPESNRASAREKLNQVVKWFTRKQAPFSLAELAWVRFRRDFILELYLRNDRGRIRVGLESLKENLTVLTKVWRDLEQRRELREMAKIVVYQRMGWVGFSAG